MNKEYVLQRITSKIEEYKNTEHYSLLINSLGQRNISLSDEAMFNLLAFSADTFWDEERDKKYIGTDYEGTFWNRLSVFFLENPFLFSIAEIAELKNSVKFLVFVKEKWLPIVKSIFSKYPIRYELSEVTGADASLSAFTFYQTYNSYDEWETEEHTRSSVAQRIQYEIQEINGITADLFSLYLTPDYRASFAILSPGSVLDLFTGKDRDSNSYIRTDLQQLFRSSWEANIARILNYKGISWEYEKKMFTMEDNTMYLPDFFLEDDIILEVKGYWDADSRKKVTTFQKENPNIRLMILDADMYFTLGHIFKQFIPEWENEEAWKSYSETIPLVGMKFCASSATINALEIGDTVLFKREPDNKYDKYAILATTEQGTPIGHVGSDWSFIYASKMDIGMEYVATIKEKSAKVIKVKICRKNTDKEIIYDFFAL